MPAQHPDLHNPMMPVDRNGPPTRLLTRYFQEGQHVAYFSFTNDGWQACSIEGLVAPAIGRGGGGIANIRITAPGLAALPGGRRPVAL